MTKTSDPDETQRSPARIFKWLAAGVSLMAAAVPVIGAFENWFGDHTTTGPSSTVAQYASVCNLSNARQHERERELARFRAAFEHAPNLTAARDAMLLLTKQDLATTSELENSVQALTPPATEVSSQHRLEGDWTANLAALRRYRQRLGAGVRSVAELEEIARSLPNTTIESRDADAKGHLLRLGAPDCILTQQHEQPAADWSPTLEAKPDFDATAQAVVEHGNPVKPGQLISPGPAGPVVESPAPAPPVVESKANPALPSSTAKPVQSELYHE